MLYEPHDPYFIINHQTWPNQNRGQPSTAEYSCICFSVNLLYDQLEHKKSRDIRTKRTSTNKRLPNNFSQKSKRFKRYMIGMHYSSISRTNACTSTVKCLKLSRFFFFHIRAFISIMMKGPKQGRGILTICKHINLPIQLSSAVKKNVLYQIDLNCSLQKHLYQSMYKR